MHWNDRFLDLFTRCCAHYQSGNRRFVSYYSESDMAFLEEIGCQHREFFDFVEDFCDEGDPTPSTALLVAAVRRDYFHVMMRGETTGRRLTREDIPTFGDTLEGIRYLPRVLAKARAKLRGELDPDLMYGCGGDRQFFRTHGGIHPADFLRHVWAAGEDDLRVVSWLHARQTSPTS